MAFETRYDVNTQVVSSTVAERLPAMCGKDTLTTVVSSTSMNVPSMTATATIQGLTSGGLGRVSGIYCCFRTPDSCNKDKNDSPLELTTANVASLFYLPV